MYTPPRFPSDHMDPSPLRSPLHFSFSRRTSSNRFMKASMTERLCSWSPSDLSSCGMPSNEIINLYRRWGESQIGMLITGNIMVDYDHLEAPGNAIVPPDSPFHGPRFEGFQNWAREGTRKGSLLIAQINHAGRQVPDTVCSNPISASDIHLLSSSTPQTYAKPRPATTDDIIRIRHQFVHAAQYLEAAGWDGVQLHAAHGYLLSQFLSPTTNKRTDRYGGSLFNRSRLIIEIADAIRTAVSPSFMLGIKINSTEFQEGGFQAGEAADLCRMLDGSISAFDFVELSGGTYEELAFSHRRQSTREREAFFLEFADIIAPAMTRARTFITGGLRTVGGMVNALNTVDGVGLGRPLCQEPRLCADILSGKVRGAMLQKIDQEDFGITAIASGMLMRQVGKDEEPADLSREENVKVFFEDVRAWLERLSNDKEGKEYGLFDMTRLAEPYRTP